MPGRVVLLAAALTVVLLAGCSSQSPQTSPSVTFGSGATTPGMPGMSGMPSMPGASASATAYASCVYAASARRSASISRSQGRIWFWSIMWDASLASLVRNAPKNLRTEVRSMVECRAAAGEVAPCRIKIPGR